MLYKIIYEEYLIVKRSITEKQLQAIDLYQVKNMPAASSFFCLHLFRKSNTSLFSLRKPLVIEELIAYYMRNVDEEEDKSIFHIYLMKEELITAGIDF